LEGVVESYVAETGKSMKELIGQINLIVIRFRHARGYDRGSNP
jgi:hypothetical protein